MIVKVCDKCGTQLPSSDYAPVKFPFFVIKEITGINTNRECNLCERCEEKFREWLGERDEY